EKDRKRSIIPRWRTSSFTAILGELASPTSASVRPSSGLLDKKLEEWSRNRTLSFATDLLGTALIEGGSQKAAEAAEFVLSQSGASSVARTLALAILPASSSGIAPVKRPEEAIRYIRSRLREGPRNALL